MSDPTPTMTAAFVTSLREYQGRVHQLSEGLSDVQFWARPYPYGNSIGHLTLHLTGNLSFYIGRHMAGTAYVRDRHREFFDAHPPSKADALSSLDEAVDLAVATLRAQTAADWTAAYAAPGAEGTHTRFAMFLRVVAHFHHHVGQMIYLAREHARQAAGSSGPQREADA